MPFHKKIQPISGDVVTEALASTPPTVRPVRKSLLTKLFEHQSTLKNVSGGDPPLPRENSGEFESRASTPAVKPVRKSLLTKMFERQSTPKDVLGRDPPLPRDNSGEFEPSSIALRNMVENYIEDPNNEKAQKRCGGLNLCYSLCGSGTDSSDEESFDEELKRIKGLIRCTSSHEKNLVRNAATAVEKTNQCMHRESQLQIVADALITLGYDASICKSHWEDLFPINCPAGEFKYLDVLIGGERLLIDIDFKSRFEIAHPTRTYKKISQSLPYVFVGKMDRLVKLVIVVSDAAKQSFKKRKLHVPPWRKAEYVLTKWLSPHIRQGRQTSGEGSRRNQ